MKISDPETGERIWCAGRWTLHHDGAVRTARHPFGWHLIRHADRWKSLAWVAEVRFAMGTPMSPEEFLAHWGEGNRGSGVSTTAGGHLPRPVGGDDLSSAERLVAPVDWQRHMPTAWAPGPAIEHPGTQFTVWAHPVAAGVTPPNSMPRHPVGWSAARGWHHPADATSVWDYAATPGATTTYWVLAHEGRWLVLDLGSTLGPRPRGAELTRWSAA